jgi:hypothetical protein
MLGTEERHERDARSSQSHHVADSIRIHTGLVRHQPGPAVADEVHAVLEQDLDAGPRPLLYGPGPASGRGRTADTRSPDPD